MENEDAVIAEAEAHLFMLVEVCDQAQEAYWESYDRKVEARKRLMELRRKAAENES